MKFFKLKKPKDPIEQFKGKLMTAYPTAQDATKRTNGEKLKVEHIAGNLTHQTMFQINGTHLVSMLDAFCELNKEQLPDQQTHEDFLSTVVESVVHQSVLNEAQKKQSCGTLVQSSKHDSVWAGEIGPSFEYNIKKDEYKPL
jgi:hypothetical protein